MEAECLPFSQLPGTSRLFLDYVRGKVSAPFYPAIDQLPSQPRKDFPDDRRKKIGEILATQSRQFGASAKTLANIEKLRADASAVVTGQQVTLFGGPAFAIYKALTAITVAEQLSKRGIESVPIFWLATQDHDFAEVQGALLRSPAGEYRSFSLQTTTAPADSPVGKIKLGTQIGALAHEAAEFVGGEQAALLRDCYQAEETLGSAMGRLFAKIFANRGLIVMDPLHPELQRLAAPLYQEVVKKRDELDRSLLERGKELEAAGYHQQVKVTPSSTLLFLELDGTRTPLRRVNGNFAAGEKRYSEPQLIEHINKSPETISGNALLRPVVQDYLLPTVAYVGGPAEVAYFAQAAVIYEKLLKQVTPIIPRLSATVLDARDQRLLAEYGLRVRDVMEQGAKLGEFLAARKLNSDVEKAFATAGSVFEEQIGSLEKQLKQFDPTLADAAKHSRSKIEYQLSRLRGRAANALLRRNQELRRHAEALHKSLFPNRELQERQIAGISYLARFGEDLLTRLESAARSGCNGHHVVRM